MSTEGCLLKITPMCFSSDEIAIFRNVRDFNLILYQSGSKLECDRQIIRGKFTAGKITFAPATLSCTQNKKQKKSQFLLKIVSQDNESLFLETSFSVDLNSKKEQREASSQQNNSLFVYRFEYIDKNQSPTRFTRKNEIDSNSNKGNSSQASNKFQRKKTSDFANIDKKFKDNLFRSKSGIQREEKDQTILQIQSNQGRNVLAPTMDSFVDQMLKKPRKRRQKGTQQAKVTDQKESQTNKSERLSPHRSKKNQDTDPKKLYNLKIQSTNSMQNSPRQFHTTQHFQKLSTENSQFSQSNSQVIQPTYTKIKVNVPIKESPSFNQSVSSKNKLSNSKTLEYNVRAQKQTQKVKNIETNLCETPLKKINYLKPKESIDNLSAHSNDSKQSSAKSDNSKIDKSQKKPSPKTPSISVPTKSNFELPSLQTILFYAIFTIVSVFLLYNALTPRKKT